MLRSSGLSAIELFSVRRCRYYVYDNSSALFETNTKVLQVDEFSMSYSENSDMMLRLSFYYAFAVDAIAARGGGAS